ncbi:MAG TPA: Gfo/Idh/MocA family oxidoreductase [Armatimonadota bacterium]|nr:Gfo/Idh/MocA family oxidoreductase [Armatimonadota bacterium]
MSDAIGVGIVGYGFAGRGFHAYLVDQEPGLELRGVFVRNEERRRRAASDRPVRVYDSYEEMLEDPAIELVILATPHDVHAEQAIQALDAGKNVVTDKIIAMNLDEARRMAAAAERSGMLFSVFHNRRWDGDFITVRRAWESGLIGQVYAVECCVMSFGAPGGWRAQKARSGGVLYDWGAHLVDQALLLCGEPAAVTAWVIDRAGWPGVDIGNFGRIVIQFSNGVLYTIETGNLARIPKPHWYLLGDRGTLRKEGVDPQEAAMLAGDINRAREDPANAATVRTTIDGQLADLRLETARGDWKQYYRNVAQALRGEARLEVTLPQMLRLMTVYDAAVESIRSGATVRIE